jgi:hypothetical protein
MLNCHRFAIGLIVILVHGVLFYHLSNGVVVNPRAEEPTPESFVVVLLKPRLILESDPHEVAPIVPLKLSATAIVDMNILPPEMARPLKLTAGIGTLAAGPGAPDLLPESRPFAVKAGLLLGQGATVVLRVEVLDDNEVGRIVVEVSGGSPEIDVAAIDYARAMPWIGAVVDGKPVPMEVRYAVRLLQCA